VCAFIEVGTALGFGRISHIEHRREAEFQRAKDVRHSVRAASVLVVGNSLLLQGVDFPKLQQQAGPELTLYRVVVENTFYLDWYYGLRRIFASGARPDAIVLVLNPSQLTSPAIGGDYTAHFLVDKSDLLEFVKETGADRNRTSSLALANLSFFYGTRAEIRNWVLGKILPDLPILTRSFHPTQKKPPADLLRELTTQRLERLRQLCQRYEAKLVFVVPPSNEDAGADIVSRAAASIGVEVLIPIAPGVLPLSDYSDRFHLNSNGASKFTPPLAAGLRQTILSFGHSPDHGRMQKQPLDYDFESEKRDSGEPAVKHSGGRDGCGRQGKEEHKPHLRVLLTLKNLSRCNNRDSLENIAAPDAAASITRRKNQWSSSPCSCSQ